MGRFFRRGGWLLKKGGDGSEEPCGGPLEVLKEFDPSRRPSLCFAHQNRTIAIASDFRVGGAKSPEISQKEGVSALDRNAALLSLVSEIAAMSGVRDGHRNRKSQKSLRFRCAKSVSP